MKKEARLLKISEDGECLASGFEDVVKKLRPRLGTILIDGVPASERYVVDVKTVQGDYIADRVTGTLYDPVTGQCLTSPLRSLKMPTNAVKRAAERSDAVNVE